MSLARPFFALCLVVSTLACSPKNADDASETPNEPDGRDSDVGGTSGDGAGDNGAGDGAGDGDGGSTGTGATGEGTGNDDSAGTETGDDASDPVDHVISTTNDTDQFEPADLVIAAGATVRFDMTSRHNAAQVSEEVYTERRVERLEGGFVVGFGQTEDIVFSEPGVYYYICEPHVLMDMVGTITVE
ncbi:MAG: hypothetical protein CL927_16075 [Deltaproteobacteria bacterium]|nr:hypothetical protein [Deltaproteobacteria bacterium]HCH61991.1 hypothetical protein [Deltaproteobacteria bacterium]